MCRYDVLVCPAFSFPAPPPGYPAWLMPGAMSTSPTSSTSSSTSTTSSTSSPGGSYTGVWSVAGNPAGVIPVTR